MAQTIKLKRGLEAARGDITPALGEIIYTTDNKELFLGDGSTAGGVEIGYLNTRTGGTVANLTITGDLTVKGTTNLVNSNEVNIGDSIIVLNADETESPSVDAGFEVERGTEDNVSILWDETEDEWTLTNTAGTYRILDETDHHVKILAADSGNATTNQVGDTLTIAGGTLISTSGTSKTITINHDSVTRSNTDNSITPAHGGEFTVIDTISSSATGHITGVNTKTVTLPAGANSGALSLTVDETGTTGNSVYITTGTGFNADSATNVTYDLHVGPSLKNLANIMTGGTTGTLRKTAADTYELYDPLVSQSNDFGKIEIDNSDSGYTWVSTDGTQVVADTTADTVKYVTDDSMVLSADATNDAIKFSVGVVDGGTF